MNLLNKGACLAAVIGVAWFATMADARVSPAKAVEPSIQCSVDGPFHVDSRVRTVVSVYINGVFRGKIEPLGDLYLFPSDFPGEMTLLRAVGADGRVWNHTVPGPLRNLHWILYD